MRNELLTKTLFVVSLAGCGTSPPDLGEPGTVGITLRAYPPATPVIFVDADDTVVAMTTTDAGGHAEATMHAGGSVNVYLPLDTNNGGGLIYTFADVDVGDAYELVSPNVEYPAETTITITVPEFPGATWYDVAAPCLGNGGGESPTFTVSLFGCGATTDFLVTALALTPTSNVTLGQILVKGVAIAPAVSIAPQPYSVPEPVTLSIANVPQGVTPFLGANVFAGDWNIGHYECGFGTATSCTIDMPVPAGVELGVQLGAADAGNNTQAFSMRTPFPVAVVPDYAANLMSWASAPQLDAAHGRVTWTEIGGGPVPIDGVVVETSASIPQSPNPILYNRYLSSRYHGFAELHIPRLPPPYDVFDVTTATSYAGVYTVGFGPDYARYRLAAFNRVVDHALFEQFPRDRFSHAGIAGTASE